MKINEETEWDIVNWSTYDEHDVKKARIEACVELFRECIAIGAVSKDARKKLSAHLKVIGVCVVMDGGLSSEESDKIVKLLVKKGDV